MLSTISMATSDDSVNRANGEFWVSGISMLIKRVHEMCNAQKLYHKILMDVIVSCNILLLFGERQTLKIDLCRFLTYKQ